MPYLAGMKNLGRKSGQTLKFIGGKASNTQGVELVAVSGPMPNWLDVIKEEVGRDTILQDLIVKGFFSIRTESIFLKIRPYSRVS